MKKKTRAMALCAMLAALCVVLMLLGAVLELGMYACPLFAGLCFIPVGQNYGRKYQLCVYAVTAVLCLLLVPNIEENLMFAGFFGWYPILRPALQRLPRVLRWCCKAAVFNAVVIAIQWLVMTVLVPEVFPAGILWVLLVLGNVLFVVYDMLIPKAEQLLARLGTAGNR